MCGKFRVDPRDSLSSHSSDLNTVCVMVCVCVRAHVCVSEFQSKKSCISIVHRKSTSNCFHYHETNDGYKKKKKKKKKDEKRKKDKEKEEREKKKKKQELSGGEREHSIEKQRGY